MATIREYRKEDGSVSYHVEVRLRGQPTERRSFTKLTLARKWIQDTESAIRDGRHFKNAEAKKHTLSEMIDRFILQWLPNNPKGKTKQIALLTWWKDQLGHLLLSDVKPSIIAEARDTLLNETTRLKKIRSPSTVNRYLAALSKVFSIAVRDWEWLEDSPMKRVSKPKEAPARDRFLNLEEKDRLLTACKDSPNPYLYPLVSLSILLGFRFGELINLKWDDIDFNTFSISLKKTKNGDLRVIPLTEAALSFFKLCPTWGEKTGYIFKSKRRNNKSGVISIRRAFENALEIAQIEGFRWHDLRHTAASYLAMNGATQGELMAILGHRSPHMTRRYAHYSQKHIRNILEKGEKNILNTT